VIFEDPAIDLPGPHRQKFARTEFVVARKISWLLFPAEKITQTELRQLILFKVRGKADLVGQVMTADLDR